MTFGCPTFFFLKCSSHELKGNSTEKWSFTYMLGFGLVSGMEKVVLVSSLFLALISTRNDAPWWWNGIPNWSRHLSSRSSCMYKYMFWPGREVTWPIWGSHFAIRARRSWSIFSLRKENSPIAKRLSPHRPPAKTLTFKWNFIFPWRSPLKVDANDGTLIESCSFFSLPYRICIRHIHISSAPSTWIGNSTQSFNKCLPTHTHTHTHTHTEGLTSIAKIDLQKRQLGGRKNHFHLNFCEKKKT